MSGRQSGASAGGTVDRDDPIGPVEFDVDAAQPLVFDGDDAAAADVATPPPPSPGRRWAVRGVVGGGVLLVLTALGFDVADLLARAFATSIALGTAAAVVTAGAAIGLVVLLADEVRSLARLRTMDRLRDVGALAMNSAGGRVGRDYAAAITGLYRDRGDVATALERWRGSVGDAHDDRELVMLIDRVVLADLDRRAEALVLRAARDAAIASMLSPAAVIDVAVMLWRTVRVIRQIAALYGVRPGYIGSVRLFRHMMGNLAVAGLAETGHHMAIEALGGTLAAAVSTKVGQALLNGLLTARIGIAAMHQCRPLAFNADNRPSLAGIRRALLTVPRDIL
ncbi:MAG: TIGR01620 family protein [Azospirillaceae bacterium]|nr:TIGR01620 family protein [Azospirillaceae bacterium]